MGETITGSEYTKRPPKSIDLCVLSTRKSGRFISRFCDASFPFDRLGLPVCDFLAGESDGWNGNASIVLCRVNGELDGELAAVR